MPDTADAQCLRELHVLLNERAASDLRGSLGRAPTLAYTDLIFAFAFARIGAEADSQGCERAAVELLADRTELAHQWLLGLFRYRIGAARRGVPHGGIVPAGVGPPAATELLAQHDGRVPVDLSREFYTARTLICRVPVLDPEGVTDPYSDWTQHVNSFDRAVARLADERDPARVASEAVALLHPLDDLAALQRLRAWVRTFPLVRRAGRALAVEMVLALPHVVRVPHSRDTDWTGLTVRALGGALDFVSRLDDTEAFPPLLDALGERVRDAPTAADRDQTLAGLAWPCVRWFRRLGRSEAAALLDRTRDRWPDVASTAQLSTERALQVTEAHLAGAVVREYAGEDGAVARALAEVSRASAARSQALHTHDSAALARAAASASAAVSTELARATIPEFVRAVPRITNTFTTADFYSRWHLLLAEAVATALPAVGDW